jgi:hypothetical protein
MSTTGVDKSEGQCPSILYLNPRHLFYLTCGQAISKAVAWASSYLACTPSYLKAMPWGPSCLAYTPSWLGLHSKLPKGGTLSLKVPPLLCDNFLEVSRTKANTVIYNQGLNLGLNRMLKGYLHDIIPLLAMSSTSWWVAQWRWRNRY